MNTYDWFKIYNKATFLAEGLVSKQLELSFEDYDVKNILLTLGNTVGIVIDDVFLCIGLNERSPFEFEDYACYLDENDDIWVGILVPDES